MPLTYDYSTVENVTDDERVVAEVLIFATMGIGMNTITEANADEFYQRLNFYERVLGGSINERDGEDGPWVTRNVTKAEVERFIGLRTNASPLTITKFRNNVWESHKRWNQ